MPPGDNAPRTRRDAISRAHMAEVGFEPATRSLSALPTPPGHLVRVLENPMPQSLVSRAILRVFRPSSGPRQSQSLGSLGCVQRSPGRGYLVLHVLRQGSLLAFELLEAFLRQIQFLVLDVIEDLR